MARIRTVKPEFWTSEQIVECSIEARLLFIGLWNFSDDAGIHPASTRRLKMEVFPADDYTSSSIRRMLDELIRQDLIFEYQVDKDVFLKVTGWIHQKIDKPTYKYPKPEEGNRLALDERSPPEGKGREGKGKDIKHLSDSTSNDPALENPNDEVPPIETVDQPTPDEFPFEKFWEIYPRKENKKRTETAWERLSKKNKSLAMIDAVSRYRGQDKQFIPLPTTYLHGERWNDEINNVRAPPVTGSTYAAYRADEETY